MMAIPPRAAIPSGMPILRPTLALVLRLDDDRELPFARTDEMLLGCAVLLSVSRLATTLAVLSRTPILSS